EYVHTEDDWIDPDRFADSGTDLGILNPLAQFENGHPWRVLILSARAQTGSNLARSRAFLVHPIVVLHRLLPDDQRIGILDFTRPCRHALEVGVVELAVI